MSCSIEISSTERVTRDALSSWVSSAGSSVAVRQVTQPAAGSPRLSPPTAAASGRSRSAVSVPKPGSAAQTALTRVAKPATKVSGGSR
ncbi:hypothetical protein [Nonomuraea salmonea]|uniref:hypothetical protein n=1 Tax=Nonomuraea salmonea TaxID=46181 RepID=UPI002FED4ED0